MKRFLILLLCFLLTVFFFGCSSVKEESGDKLTIVTTNFPLYDFAKQIAGDKAQISMLIPPGSEVHSFEPTPKQIIEISECDVFLYVGGESDKWVETLLSSTTLKGTACALINEIENLENGDEHIWTSPKNAVKMLNKIFSVISETDNENKDYYTANAKFYTDKIGELDLKFNALSEKENKKMLVFGDRFPFAYLIKEYGFEYISPYTGCYNNTEPGAAVISQIIEKAKKDKIDTVFYIEFSNKKVANTICEETGAKAVLLHSCHNVSAQDFKNGVTYYDLMNNNLKAIEGALN